MLPAVDTANVQYRIEFMFYSYKLAARLGLVRSDN